MRFDWLDLVALLGALVLCGGLWLVMPALALIAAGLLTLAAWCLLAFARPQAKS